MSGVTLERLEGALVAAKQSSAADRLRSEADTLGRLRHPGVVELISFEPGLPATLRTVWAGTDTWDRQPPATRDTIPVALAAIATTLADIHDVGLCHGALTPDHVIVGPGGRPVLCGLGDAAPVDPESQRNDVSGLLGIVEHIQHTADDDCRSDLQMLADHLREPSADLRTFVHLVGETTVEPDVGQARWRPPTRAVAVSVAAVLTIVTAAIALTRPNHPTADPIAAAVSASPLPTRPPSPTVAIVEPSTPSTTRAARGDPSEAFIDHDGRRYSLGTTGDITVLGDWDCDGEPTPALLQPSTGQVAVFTSWPAPGGSLDPQVLQPVLDATSLAVERVGECDLLRAHGSYGSTLIETENP